MAASTKFKISFVNTPQAKDDLFTSTDSDSKDLLADLGSTYWFDVLANDSGGSAAKLYSVDSQSAYKANLQVIDGQISYYIDDDAFNALQLNTPRGETVTDTFTYMIQLGNGTLSTATATVIIEAVNHAAVIGGQDEGTVTEDGALTATGQLSIHDDDGAGDLRFASGKQEGIYGDFNIDDLGVWTYALDNTADNVQALTALSADISETFVVRSVDGTAQNVTVNIVGQDEVLLMMSAFIKRFT